MPWHRFETVRTFNRFSDNGDRDNEGLPNRWRSEVEFVTAIDRRREMYVNLSELICVDESMSRWYELGGYWINSGLST